MDQAIPPLFCILQTILQVIETGGLRTRLLEVQICPYKFKGGMRCHREFGFSGLMAPPHKKNNEPAQHGSMTTMNGSYPQLITRFTHELCSSADDHKQMQLHLPLQLTPNYAPLLAPSDRSKGLQWYLCPTAETRMPLHSGHKQN